MILIHLSVYDAPHSTEVDSLRRTRFLYSTLIMNLWHVLEYPGAYQLDSSLCSSKLDQELLSPSLVI